MTKYVQAKVASGVVKMETPIVAWALCGVILGLVVAYSLFVNAAVANVVSAKEMQSRIAALDAEVSALESSYFAAKSAVSLDDALAAGFVAGSDVAYVAKHSVGTLSINR